MPKHILDENSLKGIKAAYIDMLMQFCKGGTGGQIVALLSTKKAHVFKRKTSNLAMSLNLHIQHMEKRAVETRLSEAEESLLKNCKSFLQFMSV